jgi:hypothetical protein
LKRFSKKHDAVRSRNGFSFSEEENQENGLVIRNEELKTSATQSVIERNKVTIFHYDLIAQKIPAPHLSPFNIL